MSTLIITDSQSRQGMQLNILDSVFKAFEEDYEITSVFPVISDTDLKKVKSEDWLEELPRIHSLARKHTKVLCCGAIASATWFGAEKTIPITKVRGRGFIQRRKFTVCTYPLRTVIADTDYFRDLVFDIEKLVTHNAPMEQPDLEIILVERKKDLALLKELHSASFLGCDTETTSLSPFASSPNIPHVPSEILGIGFCALESNSKGYVIVIPQKYIGQEVLELLTTYKGTLVFQNLKFDVQHLWKKYGKFSMHHLADTMLMHWSMDERPSGRYACHGLDLLQRLYFDAPPKSVKMGDWLEEYFRLDAGDIVRDIWVVQFCMEHAEMARTVWRKWYEEKHGEEPEWRGRKVGREIPISEVTEALTTLRMPKSMQPPPTKARKAEMWDAMMRYMGEDCFYTARLYPTFKEKMAEESSRLWNLHESYLIPASLALAEMEYTGTKVNVKYLQDMKSEIENLLEKEMKEIRKIVTNHTSHPKGEEFNPNSPKQVEEVLYSEDIGLGLQMPKGVGRYAYRRDPKALTTNSDTLKVLARQVAKASPASSKLINLVLSYRVKSKIVGTYVDGLLERIDSDERIRGTFNLHGTATARTSASNPNLQNIPDASHVGFDLRKAYIPTEGWIMLEADMSQLELRIAALFSQCRAMIEAYQSGADIHQEVAYMLWQKPKGQITKYERYLAKCMNFGVIYGRGAKSIATGPEMDNLVEMSGRSWSNAEIDAYFNKFKVGYKELFDWMELIKADSMKKRYVENPYGHRRRFDLILQSARGHIERQIVNTPIQGFAGQLTVDALGKIQKRFNPEIQRIVSTVHDSILMECLNDSDTILETSRIAKDVMEHDLPKDVIVSFPVLPHAPFETGDPLVYNLPFVADVVVGPSWGECKDEAEHYVVQDPDTESVGV